MTFSGLEGKYTLSFRPTDKWDGIIDVIIAGTAMQWDVLDSDRDEDGRAILGGMTSGSEQLWQDQFWFELCFNDVPPIIRY